MYKVKGYDRRRNTDAWGLEEDLKYLWQIFGKFRLGSSVSDLTGTVTVTIRRRQLEAGIPTIGRIYRRYATNIVSDTGHQTVLLGLTSQ
jgi:hypothetical protein